MPNKQCYLLFLIFLMNFCLLSAQKIPEKGIPYVKSYYPFEYQNAGRVWQIDQAPNHLLYFASEKGLLEFDGQNWRRFPGSKGFTRSIWVENDSLIYTGSDIDFGFWKKNKKDNFEYKSLYPFKENTKGIIEEFWNVYQLDGTIIFQSFNNIYVYI